MSILNRVPTPEEGRVFVLGYERGRSDQHVVTKERLQATYEEGLQKGWRSGFMMALYVGASFGILCGVLLAKVLAHG